MARRLADKDATLRQLRRMLIEPSTTEKTRAVLERAGIPHANGKPGEPAAGESKRKGHGRKPASAFVGAPRVEVKHPALQAGDRCPECGKGKVYPLKEPAVRVRIVGQARVQATVYELARLRCNLGQEVYEAPAGQDRTGVFTTGIVATAHGHKITLFFSVDKHTGENLTDLLSRRAAESPPPIQMCDALSRNVPKGFAVILGNCLAHCRRNYVEVATNFAPECQYVLEILGEVHGHDEEARRKRMSDIERLAHHQAYNGPLMEQLWQWGQQQLDQHRVEPNSGLGQALTYMLRHWEKLTLFLRHAGAPLDSNVVERALKKAILNRKKPLFYRTRNGARVGDLFMSLIHTSESCGGHPFDYLTELQRHAAELGLNPARWMPWNYRVTLEQAAAVAKAA